MPRIPQIIKEISQTIIAVSAITVICIIAVNNEIDKMGKRDAQKQLYYRELESCFHQGLVNEKQYNMLLQALEDDIFTVDFKSHPARTGHRVEWIIKTTGKVD